MAGFWREVRTIVDDLEIIDIFRVIHKTRERPWLWQLQPENESNKRQVHVAIITRLNLVERFIAFESMSDEGMRFVEGRDIFFYSEEKNVATKFMPRKVRAHRIFVPFPSKLSVPSQEFSIANCLGIERENEEGHLDQRSSPRKRAYGIQSVLVERPNSEGPKRISIYDISTGGMGLKIQDPGEFDKGQEILLSMVNNTKLTKPIKGTVVSIRQVKRDNLFKVGIQFKEAA